MGTACDIGVNEKNMHYICDDCKYNKEIIFLDYNKGIEFKCQHGVKKVDVSINYVEELKFLTMDLRENCPTHSKKYIKYCKECNKYFCAEDNINCGHSTKKIIYPNIGQINLIKNKIEFLQNQQN